jgi:hypothetical protein
MVKLIVPEASRNFPCPKCKAGELRIIDDQTVTVTLTLSAGTNHTGWYWGIGPDDPAGKYEMAYYLNGKLIDSYKFQVELPARSMAESHDPHSISFHFDCRRCKRGMALYRTVQRN